MYGMSTAGSTQAACEQSGYSQSESFNYGMAEGIKTGAKIAVIDPLRSDDYSYRQLVGDGSWTK